MSTDRAGLHSGGIWRRLTGARLVPAVVLLAVVVTAVEAAATSASATADVHGSKLSTVAAPRLTPRGADAEVRVADGLRTSLMRSDTAIAAAKSRLRVLSAQEVALLASLTASRTAQASAQNDATAQRNRLVELGSQVRLARSGLEHSVIDLYVRGDAPLGVMAAALESLTPPLLNSSTDPLVMVSYQVHLRARQLDQARSERSAQAALSSNATSASERATAAAMTSAKAESAHRSVIARQQQRFTRLAATATAQVGRAARVRSTLLRAGGTGAKDADRHLARVLQGRDYKLLMEESSRCGKGSRAYPNGRWPSRARCPLYAAPDQTLRRAAALAFNRMSNAFQRRSGSALCVTEGYRSYAEQVAVKARLPRLAASPGKSKHGLGVAVDLCGGVEDFASPAHRWLQSHAGSFGWFHPAWAGPSGGLPEPWHWEFAG